MRPQDDFYAYVNASKLKHVRIIPGFNQYSQTAQLQHDIYKQMSSLPRIPNSAFCQTLHAERLDTICGFASAMMETILTMQPSQVAQVLGAMHANGCKLLFVPQVNPDFMGPNEILYFEEYDCPEYDMKKIAKLAKRYNWQIDTKEAKETYDQIMRDRYTYTQRKDVHLCYNPHTPDIWVHHYIDGVKECTGCLDFNQSPLMPLLLVNYDNPKTYKNLQTAITEDYKSLRHLFAVAWLDHVCGLFSSTRHTDIPKWLHFTQLAANAWWQDAGHQYVQNFVDPSVMHMTSFLVDQVRQKFLDRLQHADLNVSTKQSAIDKIQYLQVNLGFFNSAPPNAPLPEDASYDECCFLGFRFHYLCLLDRCGKLPNIRQWCPMPFHLANAWFVTERNAIYIPAAIVSTITTETPAAVYGNHVRVIAHEMAHALDSQASRVNVDGKIDNWWTQRDNRQYLANQKKLAKLCKKFGIHAEQTMTENIADIVSLQLAYELWCEKSKDDHEAFFEAYAAAQICKMDDVKMDHDTHAPDHVRVNLPLAVCPGFKLLYDVKKGDELYVSNSDMPKFF